MWVSDNLVRDYFWMPMSHFCFASIIDVHISLSAYARWHLCMCDLHRQGQGETIQGFQEKE